MFKQCCIIIKYFFHPGSCYIKFRTKLNDSQDILFDENHVKKYPDFGRQENYFLFIIFRVQLRGSGSGGLVNVGPGTGFKLN